MDKDKFLEEIKAGYTFEDESIILGASMLDGAVMNESFVRIPTGTLNRHGLIAGATGTGKTKTLQILAEQLSAKGVPSLLMDIKGDLSGIAVESGGHKKIDERHSAIGLPFIADSSPVEFLSLSGEKGVRLRATVSEFGPILLGKILQLNSTQSGILSVIFKYADDNQLGLLDLKDLKKTIQYVTNEGKDAFKEEYGRISTSSTGTILRKIIELEQQGADMFFGERSFDVDDLCRINDEGKGIVSVLRVTDIQDKPKLFSTFMLQLLAEIYSTFPEEGDLDRPKLAIFIDEAHLIFNKASDALLDQIEVIVKLIRSKGVGIFFVTQNPTDIPDSVLSQLGLKIQHALRAFTAKDRKAIKLASQNYPLTEYYQVDQLLTELGIGEAIVSALDAKGRPTPLVHTFLRAPQSRMDVLTEQEMDRIIDSSRIIDRYNEVIDRDSAYELLTGKIKEAQSEEIQEKLKEQQQKAQKTSSRRKEKSTLEKVVNSTTVRQLGRTAVREFARGLFGILGVKKTRRSKNSWF